MKVDQFLKLFRRLMDATEGIQNRAVKNGECPLITAITITHVSALFGIYCGRRGW